MHPKVIKYIVKNSRGLAWAIAALIFVWFVTGILLVDYINPVAFILIWIPPGLLAAFWAHKW